jgi:hypothetical protein
MKLIRKLFSQADDEALAAIVAATGSENWTLIAQKMPHEFTARQCRDRWHNYVNPELAKLSWTEAEDRALLQEYGRVGPKWVALGAQFGGRSANSVRNRVFLLLRRRSKAPGGSALPIPLIAPAAAVKKEGVAAVEDLWSLCDPGELSHLDHDPFPSLFLPDE